jgi:hypothetical protein
MYVHDILAVLFESLLPNFVFHYINDRCCELIKFFLEFHLTF